MAMALVSGSSEASSGGTWFSQAAAGPGTRRLIEDPLDRRQAGHGEVRACAQAAHDIGEQGERRCQVDEMLGHHRPPLIDSRLAGRMKPRGIAGIEHVAIGVVLDGKTRRIEVIVEDLRAQDVATDSPVLHPTLALQPFSAERHGIEIEGLKGGMIVTVARTCGNDEAVMIGWHRPQIAAHEYQCRMMTA